MNHLPRILTTTAVLAFSGLATNCSAQATTTAFADAHAKIVTPVSILKVNDMSFGIIAVGTSPGTVVLSTAGSRSVTGGVTLPAVPGTVTAASYTVSGQASYAYGITLPSFITISNGGNTMNIGNIISNPASTGVLSSSGTQTLSVGATLQLAGAQVAGSYNTVTPFPVTVVYN